MMPWRRHRKAAPTLDAHQQADAWQLCSLLLDHPEAGLPEQLPALRAVVAGLPGTVGEPLGRFLDHAERVGLAELQRDYVDTFDVTRRCALHLTYFLHGDTRNRGVALVQFTQLYRSHGVVLEGEGEHAGELPDYLPVVLEFGATVAPDAAWKVLNDHRVGIELLRRALERRDSPWLDVVRALRATLPELDGDDEQALARLIAEGPPQESVGLDDSPYAVDPALDGLRTPPTSGCAPAGAAPHTPESLGTTIPVGAPR
ncbi:respiratory nitrate reductase chaperone NarJ [Ornithinimicrobium humiphilum]|uniref:Respiratory nitrate reductase chaperone NarJ n=1 Tax=Ornithinimicrobium humiphilum TaxID=125288 RepID=A0A543K6N4_9MICO|nr:nitrate reductase molybdenum cofactor assembly chaperone [Ornithinimicrobium humiphilum]TQM90737.1 respiratory nitrate reductase chaperone NarJ [Ornithinimicrobium humiphilum]